MEHDYPAAHSMDTQWYAVDRDGHVACFSSGEAGAVPASAFGGDEADRAAERLAQVLPPCQAIHGLRGHLTPGDKGPKEHHLYGAIPHTPTLMFLPSLDPVKAAVDAELAHVVQASKGVAVFWPELPEAEYERLHTAKLCRGCVFYFHGTEGMSDDPAAHGLFHYEHLTENWISGPYGLQTRPALPAHVDQLPPDLRRHVKSFRFDTLRFADTPYLQPVEHAPCVSWESAWLDSSGKKIRPMPGEEGRYAEAYEELDDIGKEYEIEPPGEGTAGTAE